MEMLAVLLVCLLVAAIVMPWVNHGRLILRGREVARLKEEVDRLSRKVLDLEVPRADADTTKVAAEVVKEKDSVVVPEVVSVIPPPIPKVVVRSEVERRAESQAEMPVSREEQTGMSVSRGEQAGRRSAEDGEAMSVSREKQASQDWFSKLAVWVGGVALLMAGFYMVKYSIDSGWLTPTVRLWMTTIFGALLCIGGFVIGQRSDSVGNQRIGQALTGAGVACLYFAVYAAVNLYGFLSSGAGFVGMVAVTALAVGLSLRHGAPIALMGFIGGFLTPMLMGDFREDTVSLFVYLFLLFGAAQFLCVKRGWWGLFLGTLIGAYFWTASLLFSYAWGYDVYPEGALFFILGICALNAGLSFYLDAKVDAGRARPLLWCIRIFAWGGGLLQTLVLVWLGGFGAVDMALFAVLSFGALTLAVVREEAFSWAAWLAFCAMLIGTLANPEMSLLHYCVWPASVALVFFVVGHFKALRSEQSSCWRGLSVCALIMMLLAVFVNREFVVMNEAPFEGFWLLLAMVVGGLLLIAAEHLKRSDDSYVSTVAEYSSFAVFLVGFGLWETLPTDYLSAGVAGLLFVAAVYWKVRQLARAELVFGVLAAAWVVTMLERIGCSLDYLLHFEEFRVVGIGWSELGSWYLGAAVLALILKWFGSVRKWGGWLLGLVSLLAIVASYHTCDLIWLLNWWSEEAVEGGLTALLAVLALACMISAKRWAGGLSGCWLLSVIVGYRIVVMHLFDRGAQGDGFFWNALFWQFGVPFVAVFAMAWISRVRALVGSAKAYQIGAMLLGFVWATFLVQDYSGSSRLFSGVGTSTEMYTYSVVWLLLAVAYQAMGLWRGIKTLHVGSLILLLLTVGKVFLVDASELEGLYRVLSFLGLGVALIGIGFFYNKVVFTPSASDGCAE
ncbi:Unannotated [Lentimonas sp. CC19]|nr:Unannotated [Lentimonas sp. CC10]CAA6694257.1 Unannotated [Lentimonas sp. CC19]CAA7071052.1 Unannotated [Lentimonas sp. CC11]